MTTLKVDAKERILWWVFVVCVLINFACDVALIFLKSGAN